ncbi:MAG: DUF6804 family protein [Minisyncoccales bacterium]
MIYKHQYFSLDAKAKKVFDENERELRLTGNAYRMLVFLCENKNANLTEVGDYFDWAKDYSENHIRQYRYKINTIIGRDVVEYKNGVYSLIGEVKEIENLEKSQRNTDLLQGSDIKLEKDIMNKIRNIKFSIIPGIIASTLLLLTFLDWPYGYYNFLRIIVAGAAIYYAYYLYQKLKELDLWFWGLIAIAIIFNPIVPIYLGDKTIWIIIDVIAAIFFISFIIKFKKK